MATGPSPQRGYRATCPNCGAPVEFASAASPIAVCSFCKSTLARDGEALKRIGQSAELFDDHSPLQIGSAGRHQGAAFRVVGRLQMRYDGGTWNEWHVLFDSGKRGWLSEDNGRYVMAFDVVPPPADAPTDPSTLRPGFRTIVAGRAWQVASVSQAGVGAAEGELPFAPALGRSFAVADLRFGDAEVATLDWSATPPHWSVGRSVALSELALTGLKDVSERTLTSRGVQCPNCGAALEIKLASTQSIVCEQCHSVVDVSQGVGGDLAHYRQDNASEPQIPLGTVGTLALGGPPQPWQVVGYVERFEVTSNAEDERTVWREYLLYDRAEGFAFLVDAEDGWSWSAPITGAPAGSGAVVNWNGTPYRKLYDYVGEISYVVGEFYWKLQRGERTSNSDYASGSKRLNREQTAGEVTWSAGETLTSDAVVQAFRLPDIAKAQLARDASPLSGSGGFGSGGGGGRGGSGGIPFFWKLVIFLVLLMLLLALMRACSRDDCDEIRQTFGQASTEYQQCLRNNRGSGSSGRTSGGSFGGFGSGGGGHK